MHHVGVAVRDLGPALSLYETLFGYRLLSGPYEDPIQQVIVAFVGNGASSGETVLELVAPAGGLSPIAGVLKKEIGAYHVCYAVDDLEAALERARSSGCLVLGAPVPAVAFGGRRIAWLYLPTRQLVELLEAPGGA